jgi:hypothetical protein
MGDSLQGLQLNLSKAEDDIFFADLPFFHLAEYAGWYGDRPARQSTATGPVLTRTQRTSRGQDLRKIPAKQHNNRA